MYIPRHIGIRLKIAKSPDTSGGYIRIMMRMTHTILVLSILWSYVVSLTATIRPDCALQDVDYLCNGSLKSNTTVVLDGGEHRIYTNCDISNVDNFTIMGSSMMNTTIRCEERSGFQFFSVQQLTMERIIFINCGISLSNTENTLIADCTFQNSSAIYGGAVMWHSSTGNVSITNCTFLNNIATDGGAVWLVDSTGYFSIKNCTFQNNIANIGGGGGGGALMFFGLTGIVRITNCTFQNNSANYGGAVRLYESIAANVSIANCIFQNNTATGDGGIGGAMWLNTATFSITDCIFQNNIANSGWEGGGGGAIFLDASTFSISDCIFQNNIATSSGGSDIGDVGGGAVSLRLYDTTGYGTCTITHCKFQNNSAPCGGAVYLITYLTFSITDCEFQNNIATAGGGEEGDVGGGAVIMTLEGVTAYGNITHCIFQNNSACSGGAVWLDGSTSNVSITDCVFLNNSATYDGGAILIYVDFGSELVIDKSIFVYNNAVRGAAVYGSNRYYDNNLGHLILQEVIVENNHCFCNGYQKIRGGAISFYGMKVDIIGDTIRGSLFMSNSPLGAIQGENGFLQLHGNISFINNIGENGGAISLSNNVQLYFYDKCRVEFYSNVATGFGGAIYNDGSQIENERFTKKCSISFVANSIVIDTSITFADNHAQQGGHAVYATPIYDCCCIQFSSCSYCQNLISYFTITPLPQDFNDIQVLSFPTYVQLCNCSDPEVCNVKGQYEGKVTTYPGRTVRLYVTSVDDGKNLSPSVIYSSIAKNVNTNISITLGPVQEAQWIGTVCGTIEYQIYGPEKASQKLILFTYPGSFPTVFEVELLPCEPGFIFMSNSSKCDCSPFFTSQGVVCDASDGTVNIDKNKWIGVYNNTFPALASFCPLDYCNNTINKLSLDRPEDLCNGGRTGILCGHCHSNLSVIFGSSQCQVCSDMWMITLVMFAVLGVLLVAALFFLNLTVTQGTLYGLIFYANIIQINISIFLNQSTLRPLQVIVSLVNLDLGIPLCFYDGMDDAHKAGLQFVFPAYLLILTMTVIVLCHYCLQRSPNTSTRSCVYRVFIIVGQRAVGVLSTLIYLSYSKLLRTVIDVFRYSKVQMLSGDMYVWFYDGNVEYLHGKHIVIFVVATMTCIFFLLPYTCALTFIPIIERYSEHNRLFNYLHKKANQIKPMNDAHYAPYKGEWRWWLGARLWLLVMMYLYSLNPAYSSDIPSLLLSVQGTIVIMFMLIQVGIKPFGQSEKCNKCNITYNQLYNCLDLFYLLNYAALALSMSYILDHNSDQTQPRVVCVGLFVGLYVVVVMVTVLYHLIVAILKACGMYDKAREKIDGLFQIKRELVVPVTDTVSNTIVRSNAYEREPLLYED